MTSTILFVHGYMNTGQVWQDWQKYFKAAGYDTLAPSWPYLDGEVAELRAHPNPKLGTVNFENVVAHYRKIIQGLDQPPILVGHSLGGVVVQKLLSEGLAQAAVCVNSGPPQGIVSPNWDFLFSNFLLLEPWNFKDQLVLKGPRWYHRFVTNELTLAETKAFIRANCVPSSRKIARTIPKIDFSQVKAPIFFVSGGADKSQPPVINQKNYQAYTNPDQVKTFKVYPGRTHNTLVQPGWEAVADDVLGWLNQVTG
ncbi:alpha/beta hydrolase [Leuconostocaceae bacterium ESL0723]|nr:alpha/beta hydrolase [Leuconostocaceae bacterium ESL0723]